VSSPRSHEPQLKGLGGAPRTMRMGTTASPWRYDAEVRNAIWYPMHHASSAGCPTDDPLLQELLEILEYSAEIRKLQSFFLPLIFELVQRADR
jgi:hypothetical protein